MPHYDLYIILGCFGLRHDDFISCPGVENVILKLNTSIMHYNEILDYFESYRLYDRPMLDLNAIKHFIHNLNNKFIQGMKPLWLPQTYQLYHNFILNHKQCGLIVRLALPESVELPIPVEETVLVKATPKLYLVK